MSTATYHDTVLDVYREAAEAPADNLCCIPMPPQYLPGLPIPSIMHEMNYGCGSTVHSTDMRRDQRVAYVGVGGGIEALQLAYYTRSPGGVIAVDPVKEMREAARKNLETAAETNDWFDPSFVDIRDGDALDLPLDDAEVHLSAQNCLFNIFKTGGDLEKAMSEMHRILKPAGVLVMSDPISPRPVPQHLKDDERLRAECLSGCLSYEDYVQSIIDAGFGQMEIRMRRPYRLLDAAGHGMEEDLLLETIEVAAYKTPVADDGACVFTGRTAVWSGEANRFDDGKGHILQKGLPLPVCDKTAAALAGTQGVTITAPTWHYAGGGCC